MAGSHTPVFPCSPFLDSIVSARLEALKLLADGMPEHVVVLDRSLNVVYANEAAWPSTLRRDPGGSLSKCYEAFVGRNNPCPSCPATDVLENRETPAVSCSADADGPPCGICEALPLMSAQGEVALTLALFSGQSRRLQVNAGVSAGLPVEHSNFRLGALIGEAPVMRELFRMIRLVADSTATVLIEGESGTGKELVARTIHQISYRHAKPFVVVDCGSLPETLLESELFGHVKGAFTGASVNKRGLFEEADGGTIFLDEIADTSLTFQAKLLRVLQEGEVKRVGSNYPIKIDVRVISATNKDLVTLLQARTFRQDLYYRLAVLPLYLPPLRQRRADIPLLVSHFIQDACGRHHQPPRRVRVDAMRSLIEAEWPGNVRELQHYIERAVVTTTGAELGCKDLMASGDPPERDLRTVTRNAVQVAERERILEALQLSLGNRAKAAKILKISRASLYNKLSLYHVD